MVPAADAVAELVTCRLACNGCHWGRDAARREISLLIQFHRAEEFGEISLDGSLLTWPPLGRLKHDP